VLRKRGDDGTINGRGLIGCVVAVSNQLGGRDDEHDISLAGAIYICRLVVATVTGIGWRNLHLYVLTKA